MLTYFKNWFHKDKEKKNKKKKENFIQGPRQAIFFPAFKQSVY